MKVIIGPTYYRDRSLSGLKIEFLVDPELENTPDEEAIRRFLDTVKRYQNLLVAVTSQPSPFPELKSGGPNLAVDW